MNGLAGSDVFQYSHLVYKDDLNRNGVVISLNREAYFAFQDTILLSQYHELKMESQRRQEDIFALCPTIRKRSQYINIENLKMGIGFELHLKARLLKSNYIIHNINSHDITFKGLSKEQKRRPILKDEYFNIDGYRFNGQRNVLVGLMEQSINFDLLLNKEEYNRCLNLTDDMRSIIDGYRKLRNRIHLPGDVIDMKNLNRDNLMEILVEFINKEIVQTTNSLASECGLEKVRLKELII
ncbi:hypothetical protein [Dehalobacter sp. TBBPA1]|uniref:hypothetical protein n=1 Tax=Dehalobacter sp. TBBPA1 TaxID=3235037 RepID=UPI0034A59630